MTSPEKNAPPVQDICEMDAHPAYVAAAPGVSLGPLETLANAVAPDTLHLLAPCGLRVVTACGVTFAR